MSDLISRQDAITELGKQAVLYNESPKDEYADGVYNGILVSQHIIESLSSAEPKTGECETCKRNADNGGFYDDGRTRCPIEEHYALPKDGFCHLYEPYKAESEDKE